MRGFHDGELAVQRRAGVAAQAARLSGMLAPADLGGGLGLFLLGRTFAAMSARDADGRLWVSPLSGPAGFLLPTAPSRLEIAATPPPGDPLHGLQAGQPVGLLAIEYAARRRARVNGSLVEVGPSGLVVEVSEAFGNCPQYIPPRSPEVGPAVARPRATELDTDDLALVVSVDTFVLGTTHPERGNDASHRGGAPGFLRAESGRRLVWDDLPGNQMFTSLGNLQVDPTAALLLLDAATGRRLHLSGTAAVRWDAPGTATGRQVVLDVEAVA